MGSMVTYRSSFGKLAKPLPVHALVDGARVAHESLRRIAAERHVHRLVHGWVDGRGVRRGGIVTSHGNPPASRWVGEPVTRNARTLLAAAEKSGYTAHLLVAGEFCVVEGYRLHPRKEGFRAIWKRGGADGFWWCEPWRYELRADHRSVAIDQKARVGKAGHRCAGMGAERLTLVASPWGVKIAWTALLARVREVGS